jgi:D-glycerate 3-kinase
MDLPPAVVHMSHHVLTHLSKHRSRHSNAPLIVGVQGPQGSGKTYLTTRLRDTLTADPHKLAVAVLSIDDLYLTHDGLVELARSHPQNALLNGRGQPGTHDVPLGTTILNQLKRINEPGTPDVLLPIFDKSLYGGEGDRLKNTIAVSKPLDVVIIEGWCAGFYPVLREEIDKRWIKPVLGLEGIFSLDRYKKEDIIDVNERLHDYVNWWSLFDAFIQVTWHILESGRKLRAIRSNPLIHRRTYLSTNGG